MYQRFSEPVPGRASLHIASIVEAPGTFDDVLAAHIGALRRAARLSMHQLAERADVDADVVVRLEAGDVGAISAPDEARRVIKALAEASRCSPAPLLSRIETRLGAPRLLVGTRPMRSRRRVARRDRLAASMIGLALLAASGAWLVQAIAAGPPQTLAAGPELQPRDR